MEIVFDKYYNHLHVGGGSPREVTQAEPGDKLHTSRSIQITSEEDKGLTPI